MPRVPVWGSMRRSKACVLSFEVKSLDVKKNSVHCLRGKGEGRSYLPENDAGRRIPRFLALGFEKGPGGLAGLKKGSREGQEIPVRWVRREKRDFMGRSGRQKRGRKGWKGKSGKKGLAKKAGRKKKNEKKTLEGGALAIGSEGKKTRTEGGGK